MGTSTPQAVRGTDGAYHLVYELQLTNAKPAPATINRIDVVDSAKPSQVVTSYAGASLMASMFTLQPAPVESAVIAPNASVMVYIELSFPKLDQVPAGIAHHLYLDGSANPAATQPTPLDYTVAQFAPNTAAPIVIGPPLAGDRWVAVNGCCRASTIHRGSVQSVNGGLYDSQRFAIDYMRLDDRGELVSGDDTVATNYVDYGANVLAVADATVVETLDTLPDQVPGQLPDPADITLATIDGNHVVLDLGHGIYAFYAHLQGGSVKVHVGQHVKRGTVLGLLGNSGNTSAPHLHFHLMNSPRVIGSSGLPYTIDSFGLTGQIDEQKFYSSDSLTGAWIEALNPPASQKQRFPLDLNVLTFGT
jgi:murein DD-endopeptidase MepM/ murein hydrolase activator NlpD